MPINVTNYSRSGLSDWVVQRGTAVILGAYFIAVMAFLVCNADMDYQTWQAFMACTAMKVSTIIVFLSIAAHAWIGMWTISTDYLIEDGHLPLVGSVPTWFRMLFQGVCVLFLLASVIWGTLIIWGL